MGQKINPKSLRLVQNKNWQSKWFSKKDYPKMAFEDLNIRNHILEKFLPGTIESIGIERERGEDIKILINTPRPGVLIGRSGRGTEELKNFIEKRIGKKVKIEILEVDKPEIRTRIVAENIAHQISRRISYRRAVNMAIERAKEAGVSGIKVTVSGRLGGVEIARKENFISGSVPTQTLKADIDFAKVDAHTKYGMIGVKVWIYKGS